jgi:protein tyrosine phosphatase (PTP) superfamily phosphohydrolase (DUF442 family)
MSELLDAIADLPNAYEPRPGLVTGGQPEIRHLAALRRAAAAVVVDMRDPMEPRPYEVPHAVEAAGMDYVSIPLSHTPGDAGPIGALRAELRRRDGTGVLCHCSSGNRTAAALIPYLMLDCGMPEDEAVMEAMKMGCRDSGLIEWAVDYVRKASSKSV